jgi:hypothetical protein
MVHHGLFPSVILVLFVVGRLFLHQLPSRGWMKRA